MTVAKDSSFCFGPITAELRNNVESPGGTTIAGTNALEKGGFRCGLLLPGRGFRFCCWGIYRIYGSTDPTFKCTDHMKVGSVLRKTFALT
jgi:hypothetical protein